MTEVGRIIHDLIANYGLMIGVEITKLDQAIRKEMTAVWVRRCADCDNRRNQGDDES